MATTKKPAKQPGSDIVVTVAVELIGTALMALLAGINDQVGNIVVIVMVGFLLAWLFINAGTFSGWLKGL